MFILFLSEVVFSLLLIYLILGLVTNSVWEQIQGLLRTRADSVKYAITNMLGDRYLAEKLLDHPLITALLADRIRRPSYIPPDILTSAFLHMLTHEIRRPNRVLRSEDDFDELRDVVEGLKETNPYLSMMLTPILDESGRSIEKVRLALEDLFNKIMENISEHNRRKSKSPILVIAFALAILFNVDTISIANYISTSQPSVLLPVGWINLPASLAEWFQKLLGLLITGVAVSTFAPEWFDLSRMIFQRTRENSQRKVAATIDVLKKTESKDVQQVAATQIELLDEYHKIVLDQSRKSFLSALVAAIVGLGFFLGAVISILSWQNFNAALISVLSGSLVEVISGVNFYLYAKTTAQMADFQSRLDMTQRFLLANSICENLEGDFKQNTRSNLVLKIVDPMGAKVAAQTEKPK